MKNFKVGDRVSFVIGDKKHKGKIYKINDGLYFIRGVNHFFGLDDTSTMKRLVKKKRLTFWINIYSDDIHAIHNTKESAKSSMKIDGFIRTAKFVEVKESK